MSAPKRQGAAESRAIRAIALPFGVASLVFGALVGPAVAAQTAVAPAWWTGFALTGVLGLPLALSALSFVAPVIVLQRLGSSIAGCYLVALVLLPVVQRLPPPPYLDSPWLLALTAVGTTAAAMAMRPAIVWTYVLLVGTLVAVVRYATSRGALLDVALQDALYAVFFDGVFAALALGARRSGRLVDRAAEAAARRVVAAATRDAEQREQAHVDALVHDRVLSTLLVAGRDRGDAAELLAVEADAALRALHAATDTRDDADPGGEDLLRELERVVQTLSPEVVCTTTNEVSIRVPAAVAGSSLTATAEAVRNSLRHAGPCARSVDARIDRHGLHVLIVDDGAGFDPGRVGAARLGVASSIVERMRRAGGSAEVRSSPGAGTQVTLTWSVSP